MPTGRPDLWGGGDAYEQWMGRWSRKIAPLFLAWIDPPRDLRWIDVGCGTGILTAAVLERCGPSLIVGIDTSSTFLDQARQQVEDSRASFQTGDAQAIPDGEGAFDVAVSGLVLNFVADKDAMIRELARAVRPGGIVALYVWDYAGHMQIMRHFFDAATTLDPKAAQFDDGVMAPVCRPAPLAELLAKSGLIDVAVQAIDIPAAFASFDDYWTPFLGGTGSAPKYCASLGEEERERLREAVRERLPTGPDGEILLAVRAWAVKGRTAA